MTTYRNIHGRSIQALSTDPTESVAEGQIWYNTNSDTFKSVVSLTAWSSGAPLITSRTGIGGAGTQTAALAAGGDSFPTATEEYDGSGWSSGNLMGTARAAMGACGTQTSALAFGGYISPPQTYKVETELYNGTSWSEQSDLSTARYNQGNGLGTSTAALYFAGYNGSNLNNTEEYDGSSWTNGGVYPTIARDLGGAGTQTAGLGMGGYMPPAPGSKTPGLSCTYDGSSWTAGPTMNTGRSHLGCGGTQTAGIGAGGYRTPTTAVTNVTETFDGTSFTETADLGTARRTYGSRDGTTSAFVVFGGSGAPSGTLTEEFTSSANVITAGAWASGGTFPYGSGGVTGFGGQTSAVAVGGESAPGPTVNTVSHYDGSSWTAATSYPITVRGGGTIGTQTAGLVTGANTAPGANPTSNATNEYDGSSWTAGGAYPAPVSSVGVSGVQTAALGTGGYFTPVGSPGSTAVNVYDGSSWTSGTAMNTARYSHGCSGSTTASLVFGGSPGKGLLVEDWNGSSWTALSNKIIDTPNAYSTSKTGVTADSAYLFSSPSSSFSGNPTELFNGTAFQTAPALATPRFGGSAGTPTAALAFSGYAGPGTPRSTVTEEFTAETSALNVKTLTQS